MIVYKRIETGTKHNGKVVFSSEQNGDYGPALRIGVKLSSGPNKDQVLYGTVSMSYMEKIAKWYRAITGGTLKEGQSFAAEDLNGYSVCVVIGMTKKGSPKVEDFLSYDGSGEDDEQMVFDDVEHDDHEGEESDIG